MAALVAAGGMDALQTRHDAPLLESFIEGTGPTVVMLAGGPYGATGFETHAKTLAPNFRVIRLQTLIADRAHKKGTLPSSYSLDMESAAVARTLDTLGIRGGNLHRTDEFIEIPALVERAQLLAVMLLRL